MISQTLSLSTNGRGFVELTEQLNRLISNNGYEQGLAHLFLQHTSASLILCENADPSVRVDLENVFARLIPDGDPIYTHDYEGDDDMPAHIRTVLTQNSMMIPVDQGRLSVGTWQGVYLWEHRVQPHQRRLHVSLL